MDHKIFNTTLSLLALIGVIHAGINKIPINLFNYEIIENDLVIGNLTNNSVSIFSSSVQVSNSSYEYRWSGPYTIRKIEIFNQNSSNNTNSSSGVIVTGISGGINFNFVAIYLAALNNQSGINALIRGYGDSELSVPPTPGNDFIMGDLTNGSIFLGGQQIQTQQNTYNTTVIVNGTITRVEVRDRNNNGTGGRVISYSYGLNTDRIQLSFNSSFNAGISFNISIFGIPDNYNTNNDFIMGDFTNGSIFLGGQQIQTLQNTYNTTVIVNGTITRVEARDRNNNGTGGRVISYSYGLNTDRIQLNFNSSFNAGISFNISIFGIPDNYNTNNDFIMGDLTNGSIFLGGQQIQTLQNTYNTTVIVNGTITRVEARDRNNNGTGGRVISYSYGLYTDRIQLFFNSSFNAGISFNISVFGIPNNNNTNNETNYNDFVLGYETPNSVRVFSQRVLVFPSGSTVVPSANVSYSGDGIIRKVEAIDQAGQGGFVSSVIGGLHQNQITLQFSGRAGGGIDFYVVIFAEEQIQYGQLNERSVLLYSENITVAGQNNQTANATVHFNSDGRHRIAMIDILDRGFNRTGGMVDSLIGGVGYLNTTINLRSSSVGGAISLIVNVYGDSLTQANDFRHGVLNGNSRLLRLQRIIANGHGNQNSTANFNFNSGLEVLSLVQAVDQADYGLGGIVFRTSPLGENMRNVTIDFQSTAPGRDIDFLVEVYGH